MVVPPPTSVEHSPPRRGGAVPGVPEGVEGALVLKRALSAGWCGFWGLVFWTSPPAPSGHGGEMALGEIMILASFPALLYGAEWFVLTILHRR